MDLPGGSAGKESACSAGDLGSTPGLGRFPEGRERQHTPVLLGFPDGSVGKRSSYNAGYLGSIPRLGKFPWRRERQPTPVFWPGEFHGLYGPWGCKELDMTERLSLLSGLYFLLGFPGSSTGKESTCSARDLGSLSGLGRFPGEGNGYPPQCSGLENSMDCMVHGVKKRRT